MKLKALRACFGIAHHVFWHLATTQDVEWQLSSEGRKVMEEWRLVGVDCALGFSEVSMKTYED